MHEHRHTHREAFEVVLNQNEILTKGIQLCCLHEMTQINDGAENVDCSQMAAGRSKSGAAWAHQDEKIKEKKSNSVIKLSKRYLRAL